MSVLSVVIPFSFSASQRSLVDLAQKVVERVPGLMLSNDCMNGESHDLTADRAQRLRQIVMEHIEQGYRRILVLGECYDNYSQVSAAIDCIEAADGQREPHCTVGYVAVDRLVANDCSDTRYLESAIQRVLQTDVCVKSLGVHNEVPIC